MSDTAQNTPLVDQQISVPSPGLSLLSLSIVAASASPIPILASSNQYAGTLATGLNTSGGLPGSHLSPGSVGSSSTIGSTNAHVLKHRRLSSTGKARRRLSDARDAAVRPSPATLQAAASALSSLASLSISTSAPLPPHSNPITPSSGAASDTSSVAVPHKSISPQVTPLSASQFVPIPGAAEVDRGSESPPSEEGHIGQSFTLSISQTGSGGKSGKRRGTTFTCESCSKVYRHPSCLIKHRWEHSPHWREASKFVLSKHQQVQLLEAAAILSHLSPSSSTGTSLPEDRSLWPSFLSGGALPPPSAGNLDTSSTHAFSAGPALSNTYPYQYSAQPISSSVPTTNILRASSRSTSDGPGPRLHDYTVVPVAGGVQQLRPGLLGVPIGSDISTSPASVVSVTPDHDRQVQDQIATQTSRSVPVPVPTPAIAAHSEPYYRYGSLSGKSEPWGSPASLPYGTHGAIALSDNSHTKTSGSGWSLPRSSVRSVSISSRSRSESGSRSDEEGEYADGDDVNIDVEGDHEDAAYGIGRKYTLASYSRMSVMRRGYGHSIKREDDLEEFGFSMKEEDETALEGSGKRDEAEEWDGMEMDMVMD